MGRLRTLLRRMPARRTAKPARPEAEAETEPATPHPGHASAVTADPYSFAVAHRRLAWMLRTSAMVNVGLIAVVVVLGNAIAAMAPLKTTEVALVRTYAPDDKLYQVEPITEDVRGFDLFLESMARRYVRLVLEIDPITQEARHREAARMSDRDFWKTLRAERLDTKEMAEALEVGINRTVHVETVTRIEAGGDDHTLVVDFTQVDERRSREVGRQSLRAYLSMETRPQEVRAEDRYANPLGVTVLRMVLKERT